MIAALVMAAGKSERMGFPKALLRIKGENSVQRLLRAAAQGGVPNRAVVLGHQAALLGPALDLGRIPILVNSQYELGQLSSLQCALRNLPWPECDAILVLPVDHPMISPEVIAQVANRFENGGPTAVIPTFRGKRGHPTLFSRRLFQELIDCPLELGARAVLRQHQSEIVYVPTEDAGVLVNVDTPDDYARLRCSLEELPCEGDGPASESGSNAHEHQHESLQTAARHCPRCGGKLEMRPADSEGKLQRVCIDCTFILYLNPKVVACTLPVKDGKVLLVRRDIDPARGQWTFPGGYVDLGESTQDAAIRETREEIGVQVSLDEVLGVYSYPNTPQVIIVYLAHSGEDPLVPGVEVQEGRYFAPGEIPWEDLAFRSTTEALKDWLADE